MKRKYRVNVYETYSEKPENCILVVSIELDAKTPSDAIKQAKRMAAVWNKDREIMQANIITCDGHISATS